MRTIHVALAASAVAVLVAGCASPAATYDVRMAYLRKVAQQGVDTHNLLASQGVPVIDAARCGQAWDGLARPTEFPDDSDNGTGPTKAWTDQIRQFFVDSCVSGKSLPVTDTPTSTVPSS